MLCINKFPHRTTELYHTPSHHISGKKNFLPSLNFSLIINVNALAIFDCDICAKFSLRKWKKQKTKQHQPIPNQIDKHLTIYLKIHTLSMFLGYVSFLREKLFVFNWFTVRNILSVPCFQYLHWQKKKKWFGNSKTSWKDLTFGESIKNLIDLTF